MDTPDMDKGEMDEGGHYQSHHIVLLLGNAIHTMVYGKLGILPSRVVHRHSN